MHHTCTQAGHREENQPNELAMTSPTKDVPEAHRGLTGGSQVTCQMHFSNTEG